jgi:hypothetical protein
MILKTVASPSTERLKEESTKGVLEATRETSEKPLSGEPAMQQTEPAI